MVKIFKAWCPKPLLVGSSPTSLLVTWVDGWMGGVYIYIYKSKIKIKREEKEVRS